MGHGAGAGQGRRRNGSISNTTAAVVHHQPPNCQPQVVDHPVGGGGVHAEEWGTWASRAQRRGEAQGERPEGGGAWAAKPVKRPPQQPAQPGHTNHWAPRTRKRHQREHLFSFGNDKVGCVMAVI